MPNHPHATMARSNAGMFEPSVPNDARTSTGNGTPYFVPGCALSVIGMSTMTLPRKTVRIACRQFIPCSMSPLASV
jgi:hypothetical protein